jgi:hypothetical protein
MTHSMLGFARLHTDWGFDLGHPSWEFDCQRRDLRLSVYCWNQSKIHFAGDPWS